MAEIKTKPTRASVAGFLAKVSPAAKRADSQKLCALMERITGQPPVMWGPSIVGFGSYHYRYQSGHEADMCRIGFSPRANALTLYIMKATPRFAELLAKLGKHKESKACLYITKLADVDTAVLERLIDEAWRHSEACEVCGS